MPADSSGNTSLRKHELADFKVYPNPARDQVAFAYMLPTERPVHVQLFDLQGRMVLDQPMKSSGDLLSVNRLEQGVYQVLLIDEDAVLARSRLLLLR